MDISKLSPELLQELLSLSSADEEGASLDEQVQQARALQQPSGAQHSSVGGAVLGGIGDVVRTIYGGQQLASAKQDRAALQEKKLKSRSEFAKLLFGMGQQPQDAPTANLSAAEPFGYGGSLTDNY